MAVSEPTRAPRKDDPTGQIGQTVQLLKEYAIQETLAPLKNVWRWIGFGLAGALLLGIGTAFLALGALRMAQTEWPHVFQGRWMELLPYLIGLVFCLIVAALAVSRINKQPLTKEKR